MTRHALIIATSVYADSGLPDLNSPLPDSEALYRVLVDQEIGGYDVHKVVNVAYHVIGERIGSFLAGLHPSDTALIYINCHGLRGSDGELYFAATNTQTSQLEDTSVPAARIARQLERSPCRNVVLVLDCCFSGAFSRGFLSAKASSELTETIRHTLQGEGRAIITATTSTQPAFEEASNDSLVPAESIFSGALVKGLETGDADIDGDGLITVSELFRYLYGILHPRQTPTLSIISQQGDIVVANSRKRVAATVQTARSAHPVAVLLPDFLSNIEDAFKFDRARRNVTGLRTGLRIVDGFTGGMNKGDLWLVVEQTQRLSSATARSVALSQALDDSLSVGLASFDEDIHGTIARLVSARSGIRLTSILSGTMSDSDWSSLARDIANIADSRLSMIDAIPARPEALVEVLTREFREADSIIITGGELIVELTGSTPGSARVLTEMKELAVKLESAILLSIKINYDDFARMRDSWSRVCDVILYLEPDIMKIAGAYPIDIYFYGLRGNPWRYSKALYEPAFERFMEFWDVPYARLFSEDEEWLKAIAAFDDSNLVPLNWEEEESRESDLLPAMQEEASAVISAIIELIREGDLPAGLAADLEQIADGLRKASGSNGKNWQDIMWWKARLAERIKK